MDETDTTAVRQMEMVHLGQPGRASSTAGEVVRMCDEIDRLRAERVPEGHARINGQVVELVEVRGRDGSIQPIAFRRGTWHLGMESDCWMNQQVAYVVRPAEEEG